MPETKSSTTLLTPDVKVDNSSNVEMPSFVIISPDFSTQPRVFLTMLSNVLTYSKQKMWFKFLLKTHTTSNQLYCWCSLLQKLHLLKKLLTRPPQAEITVLSCSDHLSLSSSSKSSSSISLELAWNIFLALCFD